MNIAIPSKATKELKKQIKKNRSVLQIEKGIFILIQALYVSVPNTKPVNVHA